MSDAETKNLTGLALAPATLILTMGVFVDMFCLRKQKIPQTENEDCKDCISDRLFTTAWLNLLFSGTYALLATIYYYIVFENDLRDLFAISGGVFMISRITMYLHFIVRNHEEQLRPDNSRFWYIVGSTTVVTTVFTIVYAVLFWRRSEPGGFWLFGPDAIYSLYIMYLVWGYVSDIQSPRRISHDQTYTIVQHTVIFTAAVIVSWIMLSVSVATGFSPLGLISAAFNSVFVDLLFKGNEDYYEKCCCCHSCVWNCSETTSQHTVTSDTKTKSRSSREGMISVEMTAGGEGTNLTAKNSETQKEDKYVE